MFNLNYGSSIPRILAPLVPTIGSSGGGVMSLFSVTGLRCLVLRWLLPPDLLTAADTAAHNARAWRMLALILKERYSATAGLMQGGQRCFILLYYKLIQGFAINLRFRH